MITSHAHQPLHSQNSTDSSLENMTSASAVVAAGQGTLDRSAGSADPFSGDTADSPAQFEDDFDIPPINLPPSALEDQQNQHQPDYNNGASYQHYQHQNQHMYSQQQHHYQHPQQHTQQQWTNNQYMNNGYPPQYNEYNNGSTGYGYNMHYQQQQHPPSGGMGNPVAMGGPSPGGGSHNTPSPTGHSDDGDQEVRNNNILKQPQGPYMGVGGGVTGTPPGGPGGVPPHGAHPYAHYHGVGPHSHPHHGQHLSIAHHHHHVNVIPKKPKVSKRKKKRDPNEPQKPVSAYALFFRDSQASIKAANPNAAFGDVSKIVASMWDNLDPEAKANYKKRTENAKKDYLKKLAAYRASLVSKGSGDIGYGFSPYGGYGSHHDGMKNPFMPGSNSPGGATSGGNNYLGQPIPPRPPMQQAPPNAAMGHHMHHQHGAYMVHGQGHMQNGMMSGPPQPHPQAQPPNAQMHPHGAPAMHPPQASPLDSQGGHSPTSSNTSQTPQTTPTSSGGSGNPNNSRDVPKICGRPGCNNPVQRSPDGWQSDFCSNECVVGQCRDVYTNWSSSGTQQGGPQGGGTHQGGPTTGGSPYMSQPHQQQQQSQPHTAVVK